MKNEKIRAILFDVDGVIVRAEQFSKQYQKKFGISNDEMLPFFKGAFQDCIVGKADLKEELKLWLEKWRWTGTVEEFLQFWFKSENQVDERIIEEIKWFKRIGIKCYLATKQEKYRIKYMKKEMNFEDIFDGIFSSAELGVKKPNPEFFQKVLDRIGFEAETVLFFDDEQDNIDGAESLGIKSLLYTDFEKFERDIKKFIN